MNNLFAIDIGGSAIKYARVDLDGNILTKGSINVNNDDLNEFLLSLTNLVNENKDDKTIGIAISSPGSVDSSTKLIHGASAVACIHENDWINKLELNTNLSASVINDANAALLAEVWMGNAKGLDNVISVVIGSGIGGGIYSGGKIIEGAQLYGGEFGYNIIRRDNQLITISELISTNALVLRIQKLGFDVDSGVDVFKLADSNFDVANELDSYYMDLAIFIYNIAHNNDPDLILLGGGISSNPNIIENIKLKYHEIQKISNISDLKLNINTCKFNNDSNLLGATKFYLDQMK